MECTRTHVGREKQKDGIRFLGWSWFQADLRVGNGKLQMSSARSQRNRAWRAKPAKSPQPQPLEMGNGSDCGYMVAKTALVIRSRIATMASISSRIDYPCGRNNLLRRH